MKTITQDIVTRMFSSARERMLQDGWKEHEISSFMSDPVIQLFYGACAEEIGKVKEDVYHVENSLIDKTLEYLLPEDFHTPAPAHAIFSARPIDKLGEVPLWPDCQFFVKNADNVPREFTFTPAGNFTLHEADLGFLLFRNKLVYYEDGQRTAELTGESAKGKQDDAMWLGFRNLNNILPKSRLPIFFGLPRSGSDQYGLVNALRFAKWSTIDGTQLEVSSGLANDEFDYREKSMKQPDFLVYRMFDAARKWYKKQYFTLHDIPVRKMNDARFPPEIHQQFPANEIAKIKEDITWIKLSFASLLKESWFDGFYCSLNSFPALNLKIQLELFDVENMPVNIYPVSCDDHIIGIKSIMGKVRMKQEETEYNMVDTSNGNALSRDGDVVFRSGYLGRLNAAKLRNMLNLLTSLLKEETVLLTRDGTKEDLDKLNRLNRAVNDFEKVIETERELKSKHTGTVLLKPMKDHNRIFIRFWSTTAEDANQIKPLSGEQASTQCSISFGPDIKSDSIRLISNTIGGRKQVSEEEYHSSLRKILLTRNRIVTPEDAKAFCIDHFSPKKVRVEVKKGLGMSRTPGNGLERRIEVTISYLEKTALTQEEIEYLQEELLMKLTQHSSDLIPFHVEILPFTKIIAGN